ncbi:MAG TPA: ABC transporter permease subunit, partial [Candidatus Thermoplasmatota archaeon]|nr:ABC transporter permease subunit [Candidatus Thermoplasmatota archaeon]
MRAPRPRLSVLALLAPPLAFLAVFYGWPLARMLAEATADGWSWLATPYVAGRLRVAFLQALLSTLLTLGVALPLAWLHHARAIPWSRTMLALHAAPFVLPVFVVVYGIQLTVGAALPPLAAVVLAHAYYNHGFAARVLHAALDRRPRRLEEAARTLGASRRGAAWRVTLPLLAPSVAAVALLVFLFSFSAFGTVLFLGGGVVSTPETLMYAQLGGAFPRLERAAALGGLQLLLSFLLFLAYLALLRRTRGLEQDPDARRAPARPAHVGLALGALAVSLAPVGAVLAGGFRVRGEWTLEAWRALLDPSHPAHLAAFSLPRALGLSLLYAACATLLALALTTLLAYGLPASGRARRVLEAATAVPLGTSSLLLGFGYLLAFGAGALLDLRGTFLVVVIVHALVAFPFAARVLIPAFEMRDRRLDEAAALLGASPLSVARRVHLPLLAAPLLTAAGLAAAASLGDFGASLLLMRPD